MMTKRGTVLYIGGFELPDKNAAAQRVIGIAKGLRELDYNVVFLNSVCSSGGENVIKKEYFGFACYEYRREKYSDYLLSGRKVISLIKKISPDCIIAYNYPAIALEHINRYARKNKIKCIADVTEWRYAFDGNVIYRIIKNIDTLIRMKYVHKKLDGIIAISRLLNDYYKRFTPTVLIPPTVDIDDKKWIVNEKPKTSGLTLVYAGSPSKQKERLDYIVDTVETIKNKIPMKLMIVGITKEQFLEMYSRDEGISDAIEFVGRISHQAVLKIVKKADWSIILRDNNKDVQFGFPTKLVESISCGTPVIVNDFSNVKDFLNASNSIVIQNIEQLEWALSDAVNNKKQVDNTVFDYRKYVKELERIMV